MKNTAAIKKRMGYDEHRQGVSAVEWVTLGLIAAFCFLCFYYVDMDSIIDNTVLFARSILNGNLTGFYEYSVENFRTAWAANYEAIVYVIFAIWNIPMLIANIGFGVDYMTSFPCLLWSKLMVAVFTAATAYVIYKICGSFGLSRRRSIFGAFLFCSSTTLMFFTMVVSQCDIVSVFFMLLGCYFFTRKKYVWFVAMFAIAIPLKMFALFIFVPLVLLWQKNVFKVVGVLACGFSLQLLHKLIFAGSEAYSYALSSNTGSVINNMLSNAPSFGGTKVPLYPLALVLICIYCYMQNPVDFIELAKKTYYVCFLAFAALFVFYPINSYWIVILLPFMAIVTMQSPVNFKLNLFLDAGIGFFYTLMRFANGTTFVLLNSASDKMLLRRLVPIAEGRELQYESVKALCEAYSIDFIKTALFAVFVACLIAFAWVNFPKAADMKRIGNTEKIDFSVIWARFAVTALLLAVLVYPYVKTVNAPLVNTTTATMVQQVEDYNIMESEIVQPLRFSGEYELSELRLQFNNRANSRKDVATVTVAIVNSDGERLFEEIIGTSVLKDKREQVIKLKGLAVNAEEEYSIVITGKTDKRNRPVYPYVTEQAVYADNPLTVDGVQQNCNLYMEIR